MKKLLIFLILLLPLISAESSFIISLESHYYIEGQEILVYNNNTPYDGLSFDVVAKNKDIASRIINMRITKLSPELKGAFENTTEMLISSQKRVLWTSKIIDTTNIKNNSAFFYVGVTGKNEVLNMTFYTEGQANYIKGQTVVGLNNPKPKEELLIKRIGDFIWPGKWQRGVVVGGILILLLIYIMEKRDEKKIRKIRGQERT